MAKLKAWPNYRILLDGIFSNDIQHCWTGGKTLSNIQLNGLSTILEMSYLAGDSKENVVCTEA